MYFVFCLTFVLLLSFRGISSGNVTVVPVLQAELLTRLGLFAEEAFHLNLTILQDKGSVENKYSMRESRNMYIQHILSPACVQSKE